MTTNSLKLQSMSKETEISIVIPFYNEALNLGTVLKTLYEQTNNGKPLSHKLYEIILVDNNSTDHSIDVIQQFTNLHPDKNIYVVSEQKTGVAWARKTGMDVAAKRSHERDAKFNIKKPFYIFGADADCTVDKNWLYELYLTMQTSKAAIGICKYYYLEKHFQGRPKLWNIIEKIMHARHVVQLLFGGFPDGKGFAVARDKYEKIGGIEIFYQLKGNKFVCHLSDDWDFCIKMRASGEEIVYSPKSKVEINSRRLDGALDETLQGKAYGEDGIIVMRDIRPKNAGKRDRDLTDQEANLMWDFAIKDFTPKNVILPVFLTPTYLEKMQVREFFTTEFADELIKRIAEIKNEIKMHDFTPIHSYKTPCARLYFEYLDIIFARMRKMINNEIGYPPALPKPLQSIAKNTNTEEFKQFIHFYCEDRESGHMHNYFANGGVF